MSVIAEILRDTKEELLRDMCLIETSLIHQYDSIKNGYN
jgi:hypothetical protein